MTFAGDMLPNGQHLREKDGHYNEMYGPYGFNSKQYFFSPVAAYSSSDVYSTKTRYALYYNISYQLHWCILCAGLNA